MVILEMRVKSYQSKNCKMERDKNQILDEGELDNCALYIDSHRCRVKEIRQLESQETVSTTKNS